MKTKASLALLLLLLSATFTFASLTPKKYMVVLKNDLNYSSLFTHFTLLRKSEVKPRHFEFPKLQGYIGNFQESQILSIMNDPAVDYVEEDQPVHAFSLEVEHNSPWGLDRVSHRKPSTCTYDNPYDALSPATNCTRDYLYDSNDGSAVTVFIIDTGIFVDHSDFEGRASFGPSFIGGKDANDGNGHGSHCAGTIGGKTYGVAKKAKLVGVRVLDENGSGSMSGVLQGVEWVTQQQLKNPSSKMVISMSLGGGKSRALDAVVNAAVDTGIFVITAAGNEDSDACKSSPAGAAEVVTVGSTDYKDNRSPFSNVGKCVDIFAPGSDITSVWIGKNDSTNTISGTSMACPHVAGVVASFLSRPEYASFTPKQMKRELELLSTKDVIKMNSPIKSPNRLLYSKPPVNEPRLWDGFYGLFNYTFALH